MSVKIGNIDLGNFPLLLAPMEDVSDPPFRSICKKYGADLIKFCATGGVMSKNTNLRTTQYTADEMEAIVDEAHNRDMKVAAHAHGLDGI